MRVNEYGLVFRIDTRFNLNAETGLTLTFTKPDNTTLVRTNPDVTVGDVDVDTEIGLFLAEQYARYTFQDGDVDLSGDWSARLTYLDSSHRLISAVAAFTVDE